MTIQKTRGAEIQTFNGILDFIIQRSDIINPDSDFKLDAILPTCDGGSVINESFSGFIDYEVVCRLDEEKLTDSNLWNTIDSILNRCNAYCKCQGGNNIQLNSSTAHKCACIGCQNLQDVNWYFDGTPKHIVEINSFLKYKLNPKEIHEGRFIRYEVQQVKKTSYWADNLREYIKDIVAKKSLDSNEFIIPSKNYSITYFDTWLVAKYSTPIYVRITPRTDVTLEFEHDVFGIKKRLLLENSDIDLDEKIFKHQFNIEESKKVCELVTAALDNEKQIRKIDESEYYRFNFDRDLLNALTKKYHVHRTQSTEFLTQRFNRYYTPLCSSKIANCNYEILDIEFFWCRGQECFRNCLSSQVLANCNTWKTYTLLHLSEIIGFQMIERKDVLYETKEVVSRFISAANKARQKYKKLKCRECGHLIFNSQTRGSDFNQFNYFECLNPNCSQYRQSVYVNFCFRCKKGLIDSRDTQRCPNNWYICPSCLSCCDDQQYERKAQKYKLNGQRVPDRIQRIIDNGMGHNNHGLFFCCKCGGKIERIESDNEEYYCPSCKNIYTQQLDNYYYDQVDIVTNRREVNNDFRITIDNEE